MKAAPATLLSAAMLWSLCVHPAPAAATATESGTPAQVAVKNPASAQAERAALEFFEQKVRPLLEEKCLSCHSEKASKQKGGLLLDSRDAILKGGESGAAAQPGDPAGSLLLRAVQYQEPDLQMPPKERLSQNEVAILERWISEGMPFPSSASTTRKRRTIDYDEGRKFWSFQPLQQFPAPPVKHADWPRNVVDSFVLARLEAAGLSPAPEASRGVLLRRTKFALLGLPPTPEEVEAFEQDAAPDAFERRVDGWLASPHYGERWARHWLDLVRYCDTPESWLNSKGKPHLYRDWVVNALNTDTPYPRFIALQLAADLAHDAQPADRAALGFLGLSPNYWKELQLPVEIIKTIVSDEYEERVHTLSATLLGVNLACARCHDHKYDPFSAEDYYGIAGVLASTRVAEQSLDSTVDAVRVVGLHEKVAKAEDEIKKLKAKKNEDHAAKIAELEAGIASTKADPQYTAPLVPAVREGSLHVEPNKGKHGSTLVYQDAPQDLAVEVRGNPNRTAQRVPRRMPLVFTPGAPVQFTSGSGRLELADALFREARPLVARVIVNRLWAAHFGTGIVPTPSDFGAQGEKPTHPELLDQLASGLVQNGWSLKWLHRTILLSATYRQTSGSPTPQDPDLRLYSKFPRKRLEVEQWRDALLAVSGELDLTLGGPALELAQPTNRRRTLYGLIKRRELSDILRLHDFPDPITHSPSRIPTTTPLQQLFTMNSPLMQAQARALEKRLAAAQTDPSGRVELAYRLALGRMPTSSERAVAARFLESAGVQRWPEYLQVLLGSNEFLFLD
jgi:hypothetical protein